MLPGFTFSVAEAADRSGCDTATVLSVLLAFSLPPSEKNTSFKTINDFNAANATPLLRISSEEFILFQTYSLVEALYEAPFYWMVADRPYRDVAMNHRGQFTENFSRERLNLVFGQNVYSNVNIIGPKGQIVGEIDVLVVFANRAIVLQAKSKRLTLEARKGYDGPLQDDFKKSIQDSYDQGYECATLLSNSGYKLFAGNSQEIYISVALKEIYLFCVVADHYPALAFQARQFLRFQRSGKIHAPFVMDVFLLDAMTELLRSPLHFLSYTNRRTGYSEKLHASNELTILAFHLTHNLWLDDQYDMVALGDDFSASLDIAMAVRRDGIDGSHTPDGILTRLAATSWGKLIGEIEARPDPGTIDLGFMLLALSEDAATELSMRLDDISRQAQFDRKHHDLSIGIAGGMGLTIHCNDDPIELARSRLQWHCERRKYTGTAKTWFGICVLPGELSLRFGLFLDYEWQKNEKMEEMVKGLTASTKPVAHVARKPKTGRNDPCPCGSGKKYKKCHRDAQRS